MKIHCLQLDISWENKTANFRRVEQILAAHPPAPGSLVLLPEMFATGFSMNTGTVAEENGGPTEQFLSATARQFNLHLMGGLVPKGKNGRGQNQAVVFSPDGRELARYSKIQPFTHGGEAKAYEAGSEIVLFPWQGFRVAPFICYDLRFPEHFRAATRQGAQLITVIANWPIARIQHWITLLQARAVENQAYVAGVNRCGTDPQLVYNGRSLIISPAGEILADAGNGETMIEAEIDPAEVTTYRQRLPFLADMK